MQALLYAPMLAAYRIRDAQIKIARDAATPVIYVVTHRSRLDPALMLALLPDDTLHILDEFSARSAWLEPYRSLARTIARSILKSPTSRMQYCANSVALSSKPSESVALVWP